MVTLADAAQRCGIEGKNPARTFQRYETGETACSLDITIQIVTMTEGAVTLSHLRNIRLAFLNGRKANLPKSPAPVTGTEAEVVR